MRGKGHTTIFQIKTDRITPAYAGKSPALRPEFAAAQDHPRLCGEKLIIKIPDTDEAGSPPPMRGKVFTASTPCVSVRITPAYAGKRIQYQAGAMGLKDHPRLCGEKYLGSAAVFCGFGSPPPMRGKDWDNEDHRTKAGITPAYAGKSSFFTSRFPEFQDHPRLCGEKAPIPDSGTSLSGSPPPMRGKGGYYSEGLAEGRITPAYAGKRTFLVVKAFGIRDHPRLCGEKTFRMFWTLRTKGSPPPMRGKAEALAVADLLVGITPAYAGKRSKFV